MDGPGPIPVTPQRPIPEQPPPMPAWPVPPAPIPTGGAVVVAETGPVVAAERGPAVDAERRPLVSGAPGTLVGPAVPAPRSPADPPAYGWPAEHHGPYPGFSALEPPAGLPPHGSPGVPGGFPGVPHGFPGVPHGFPGVPHGFPGVPPQGWTGVPQQGSPGGQALPGGLPHGAPPRSAAAGSRGFVVALVAVLGMLFASGMVAVGYTVLDRGGLGTPGASARGLDGPAISAPAVPVAGTPDQPPSSGPGAHGRTPGASPSVDEVYLTAMRQRPVFAGSTDAELYALGGATCGKLDSGASFITVVTDGGGRNLPAEDMGYLTGVSVMAYCPQHKPMLEQLIGRPLPAL